MTYIGKKPENIISTKIDTTTGTFSGEVDAGSLDISGNADIDGTLEADAITIDGTAIASVLSPIAGSSSIVTTGALNAGSITSGFGSINNGSSTITTTGAITGGSLVADNITIDGTEIDLSSGNLTIDVAGAILLDADVGNVQIHDAGTEIGRFANSSSDFVIKSAVSDKDMIFKGNDGGSEITALTLDMSIGGVAKFGAAVQIPQYLTHLDDTDTFLEFGTNQIDLYAGNAKAVTIGSSQVIINQDSADMDFRVESNDEANALFVDGGNNSVCIGKSSDVLTEAGSGFSNLQSGGHHYFAVCNTDGTASNSTMYINRQSADGTLIEFRKANSAVGTIGSSSSKLYIASTGNAGLRFRDDLNCITPCNADGSNSDADQNLGQSGVRFQTLFLSGGVRVGGTGTANKLDDYEEGTWTPTLVSTSATFQYSVQSGFYTKVGRVVNFTCVIQLDGGGNSFTNNSVALNGWPFQSTANAHSRFFIYGRYLNLDLGNGYTYAYAHLNGDSSSATLHESGDNVPTATIVSNDLSSSSGQLYLNGQYITDS